MDIVGAINHNLQIAGVRPYERHDVRNAQGQLGCEVGWDIPTPRGARKTTRIRAFVPYDDMMPGGVGYEEVGGKLGKKIKKGIKKAAKKVAKSKIVKAVVKVAKPLSNLVAPGAAAALTASTKLIKKSAKLVKSAKGGNKKAAKALTAPLAFKASASTAKPAPAPRAARALPAAAVPAPVEAGPAYDQTSESLDDGDVIDAETWSDDGGDADIDGGDGGDGAYDGSE